MSRISIIGDGAWGTAIGLHLHRIGHSIRIWGPFRDVIEETRTAGENRRFLPGFPTPDSIVWTCDPEEAVADAETVVGAVPSRFFSETLRRFASFLPAECRLVTVTKGLAPDTGERMSQVAGQLLAPRPITALSGPSFAVEVARGLPTAVVAASTDPAAARTVQALFSGDTFRVYTSDDVIGVELGGVLKNIVAIAAGAADALAFGTNARAALITRGLAEMTRLGVALGAHPATFSGLSGLGDLILTCTGPLSRNRRLGERIGGGEPVDVLLAGLTHVAEGAVNCATAHALARKHDVDAPIIDTVFRVLHEHMPPRDAVAALMSRDPKPEREVAPPKTKSF